MTTFLHRQIGELIGETGTSIGIDPELNVAEMLKRLGLHPGRNAPARKAAEKVAGLPGGLVALARKREGGRQHAASHGSMNLLASQCANCVVELPIGHQGESLRPVAPRGWLWIEEQSPSCKLNRVSGSPGQDIEVGEGGVGLGVVWIQAIAAS